jgi:hypothetical protein
VFGTLTQSLIDIVVLFCSCLVFRDLNSWEKEALVCVYEYMKAFYTAIFAQCAGVQTFKRYKNIGDRLRRFRLDTPFFLETMFFDPRYPFLCYPFPKYSVIYPEELPWRGFDVLSHLMTEVKKAKRTPAWILDICSRYKRKGNDRVQPFLDRTLANITSGQETGLRANLPTGHSNGTDTEASQVTRTQRTIYQQRAWVFFDDARLCPGREAHFPTAEEMKTEIKKLENERIMETRKHWEKHFDKKRPNPPWYKSTAECVRYDGDMEMEEDREIYLGHLNAPPFFALH